MDENVELFRRLRNFSQFNHLPDNLLMMLANDLEELAPLTLGAQIIAESATDNDFYIIERGRVQETSTDVFDIPLTLRSMKEGDFFGHFSLLKNVPHGSSVTAFSRLFLLRLNREKFLQYQEDYPEFAQITTDQVNEDVAGRMEHLSFLGFLPPAELKALAPQIRIEHRGEEAILFKEGEMSTDLYVIQSGRVALSKPDIELSRGNFLGEQAALEGHPRSATATVKKAGTFYVLTNKMVKATVQQQPELKAVLQRQDVVARLSDTPLFYALPDEHMQTVAQLVGRARIRKSTYVCEQGEAGTKYYILAAGMAERRVLNKEGKRPAEAEVVGPGYTFDEKSLIFGEPYPAAIWPKTHCHFLFIDKEDFDYLRWHNAELDRHLSPDPETKRLLNLPRFAGQRPDEIVLCYSRRHWIAFVRSLATPLSPLVILLQTRPGRLPSRQQALTLVEVLGIIALVIGIGYLTLSWQLLLLPYIAFLILLACSWIAWNWIDWRNDYLVITTKRVLRREKVPFLYEDELEAPLSRVERSSTVQDFWGKMLGYQDLTISTAAAAGMIKFSPIPTQDNAAKVLTELLDRQQASKSFRSKRGKRLMRQNALQERIGESDDPWDTAPILKLTTPKPKLSWWQQKLQNFKSGWTATLNAVLPWRSIVDADSAKAIVIWNKHWSDLFRRAWPSLLFLTFLIALVLAELFGIGILSLLGPNIVTNIIEYPILVVIFGAFVPVSLWLWWELADWSNDLYVLTESQVIGIEKKPLFVGETRNTVELANIQNILFEQMGFVNILLNVGNVIIETAGSEKPLNFRHVPDPRNVQRQIFAQMEAHKQKRAIAAAKESFQEFTDWFDAYHSSFAG
jgi:CRP-like cAMP-binding protein